MLLLLVTALPVIVGLVYGGIRMHRRGVLQNATLGLAVRSPITWGLGIFWAVMAGLVFSNAATTVAVAAPVMGFLVGTGVSLHLINKKTQDAGLAKFAASRGLKIWSREDQGFRWSMFVGSRPGDPTKGWQVSAADRSALRDCAAGFLGLVGSDHGLVISAVASGSIDGRQVLVANVFDNPENVGDRQDHPYSVVWLDVRLPAGELLVVPRLSSTQLSRRMRVVPTESAVVAQTSVVLATPELTSLEAVTVLQPTALVALGDAERPVEVHIGQSGVLVARRRATTAGPELDELLSVVATLARSVARREAA